MAEEAPVYHDLSVLDALSDAAAELAERLDDHRLSENISSVHASLCV